MMHPAYCETLCDLNNVGCDELIRNCVIAMHTLEKQQNIEILLCCTVIPYKMADLGLYCNILLVLVISWMLNWLNWIKDSISLIQIGWFVSVSLLILYVKKLLTYYKVSKSFHIINSLGEYILTCTQTHTYQCVWMKVILRNQASATNHRLLYN